MDRSWSTELKTFLKGLKGLNPFTVKFFYNILYRNFMKKPFKPFRPFRPMSDPNVILARECNAYVPDLEHGTSSDLPSHRFISHEGGMAE
jgi:hypothetical protein